MTRPKGSKNRYKYKVSEETKRKLSLIRTGKKKKPHTEEAKRRISEGRKGKLLGEKHHQWKGENLTTLEGIHHRIRQQKPKPEFCEICGLVPPQELSNIDHKYSLIVKDYRDLCIKCHREYDNNYNKNFKSWNEKRKKRIK